jgi:positive regulator of sigma E activity
MSKETKLISPLLYYTLVSGVTNLVFIASGVIAFVIFSIKVPNILITVILFLLIWKEVIIGFIAWSGYKKTGNKEFFVDYIGKYLGRFFGSFAGAFMGDYIASMIFGKGELIGAIVGAYSFNFPGRWLGSLISTTISVQLDKVITIEEVHIEEVVIRKKPRTRFVSILYVFIVPLIFVIIGLLLSYFDIRGSFFSEYVTIARIIAIVYSLFGFAFPWLMKKHWMEKYQPSTSRPEVVVGVLGLAISVIPVLCGFILFIAFGASIWELCAFAVASSVVAIIWIITNPLEKNFNEKNDLL